METWPNLRDTNWLLTIGDGNLLFQNYWTDKFDQVYSGKLDSWGFVWMFSCWSQYGLSILPLKNLVRNIGYGSDATHTRTTDQILANLRPESMDFPLMHPGTVNRIHAVDKYIDRYWFKISLVNYSKRKVRHFLRRLKK